MITIIADFKIKPECVEQFTAAAKDCVRGTRKEKGNISYRVYIGRNAANEFTFIEEWLNDGVIEFHNKAPHFTKFIDVITPMCAADPVIRQFTAMPAAF